LLKQNPAQRDPEMAARQYHLSRQARIDFESIVSYLKQRNPQAARSVFLALRDTFQTLAANPEIGNRRDDLHANVRIFTSSPPAHNYVVFYYARPDGIEVSDILHAARDWTELFQRGER
jgi:toxin ParE1/3/4